MKLSRDRVVLYFGLLSIEIYWPSYLHNQTDTGLYAPTQISLKRSNKWNRWMMKWAFVFKILGFGIGICWDHCDNPNSKSSMRIKS